MLRHGSGLVVTSDHRDLLGVLQLQSKEVQQNFETEDASVDVVAQKEQILPKGASNQKLTFRVLSGQSLC